MTTTLENTPVIIDLTINGKTTGWTIDGDTAYHDGCNMGSIFLIGQPLTEGRTYEVSYFIPSLTSGTIRPFIGTTGGATQSSTGFKTDTILAAGADPKFRFYSTGQNSVQFFAIRDTLQSTGVKQNTTNVWSEKDNKWVYYYTINPDWGFSLFTNFFTYKLGHLWMHDPNLSTRNNFYGNQYKSIIQFTANANPGQTKTYESISYESNQLLITTTDGIKTSLGCISDLVEADFLKDTMVEGITQVDIYNVEGVYSASFMKDKNIDIINGPDLKGTYITIELQTITPGVLNLKNIYVHSEPSKIGAR